MSDNYDTSINYWQCPVCAIMNTVALNTCRCGYSREEQESDTVNDNDNLPNVIYLSSIDFAEAEMADGKLTERNEGRWTTEKITDWTKYIRADAARGDEPEQSALSDEDAQILELVRLAKELLRRDQAADTMDIALRIKDYSLVSVMRPGFLVGSLDYAIAELRSRLAPKPQRPTKADADRLIDRLGIYLRGAIDKGDGFAVPLKIDVDDYLKRNKENGGDDGDD